MTYRRAEARDALLDRLSRAPIIRSPVIMGVLNVTPDSFSDGGSFDGVDAALSRARTMCAEGAEIIDIGGESTRPGAAPVALEDEIVRVRDSVAAAAAELSAPISIDTYKAGVVRACAEVGAIIANDVWGLTRDPEMPAAVAETGCIAVITYNRGSADASINLVDDMRAFIDRSIALAMQAGAAREHLILDPGLGFGKTYEQNFAAVARLDVLLDYRLPVLVGASRKSFIGRLLDKPVDERLIGTLAMHLAAVEAGAHIVRAHDVAEHRQALDVLGFIRAQDRRADAGNTEA